MARPERLIVGLGNPGEDYARTRHNVGFRAVESLAAPSAMRWIKKFEADVREAEIAGIPCLLLKPMTMMNLSGTSVLQAGRFYRLGPESVTVFHDDLDLQPGHVKVKRGGGAAGHNGLKSLDSMIGPAYERVRIGIGHPGPGRKDLVTDYVLSAFSKQEETAWVAPFLDALPEAFPWLVRGQSEVFLRTLRAALKPLEGPLSSRA